MDVSRKARFGGVKFQRASSLLHTVCCCRLFILLARMAFAGEAPVCKSGLMPRFPIGLPRICSGPLRSSIEPALSCD